MCHGLPAVRILDILNPEVFLSYQWGFKATTPSGVFYSTQELVKQYKRCAPAAEFLACAIWMHFSLTLSIPRPRSTIETHADVLCWLDVAGGLSAGSDHVKQMTDGVAKSHVIIVFLCDAYCMSENCRREFEQAVKSAKYMIPGDDDDKMHKYEVDYPW